jgi:hypothetical protein
MRRKARRVNRHNLPVKRLFYTLCDRIHEKFFVIPPSSPRPTFQNRSWKGLILSGAEKMTEPNLTVWHIVRPQRSRSCCSRSVYSWWSETWGRVFDIQAAANLFLPGLVVHLDHTKFRLRSRVTASHFIWRRFDDLFYLASNHSMISGWQVGKYAAGNAVTWFEVIASHFFWRNWEKLYKDPTGRSVDRHLNAGCIQRCDLVMTHLLQVPNHCCYSKFIPSVLMLIPKVTVIQLCHLRCSHHMERFLSFLLLSRTLRLSTRIVYCYLNVNHVLCVFDWYFTAEDDS